MTAARMRLCVFDVVSVFIIRVPSRLLTQIAKLDPQLVGYEPQGRSIAFFRGWGNLQRELDALRVPDASEVEEAGETLESLGREWVSAPKRYQRDMLRQTFQDVFMDMLQQWLVCVKPYPSLSPLFRLDGLIEKEGCFYVDEEEEGQETGSEG